MAGSRANWWSFWERERERGIIPYTIALAKERESKRERERENKKMKAVPA